MSLSYTTVSLMLVTEPKIGSASTVTSLHMHRAALWAESKINAALSKDYAVPVGSGADTVPILTAIATDLAIYNVLRRLFTSEQLKDSPWPARFADIGSELAMLREGASLLVDGSGSVIDSQNVHTEVWTSTLNYEPTFAEFDLDRSVRDADKIEDQLDDRGLT